MRKLSSCAFLLLFCLLSFTAQAAEDALTNTGIPSLPTTLSPGAVILMPDGGQSVILQTLPNGDFVTDLGITLSPEGLIKEGEFKGQTIKLDPSLLSPNEPVIAQKPEEIQPKIPVPEKVNPAKPIAPTVKAPEQNPKITPKKIEPAPKNETPKSPEEEKALTLAQMLPLTAIDEKNKTQPSPPKAAEKKPATEPAKKPEAKKPEPKKQAEAKPQPAKPKAGQALRIPPEAAKSGNLSFLEGCWQGTRPEYYSKRTIKECFCFGANGKNGKRRIYDGPSRMCIGGTNAKLSSNGVLSVTSSGAACNDGERWGSAEMVCHNSGPRTPCSWIFTDANNGRQAYEIPFVRVESCGR